MSKSYPIPRHILQDLAEVEKELIKAVAAGDGVLSEASLSIAKAGGKRLRPALVLISGMVGDYDLKKLMPAAVVSELIHMASLIHDDILDDAVARRGVPTINSVWGERLAVAAGDFLFAKAFEILSCLDTRAIEVMAGAARDLSLGEFDQMVTAHVADQTIEDYLQKARRKTAALFVACCRVGSLLSGAREEEIEALASYGENLGVAFQIYDDVLDIVGGKVTGKTVGVDIRDGTVTVPMLYAFEAYGRDSELAVIISNKKPCDEDVGKAIDLIIESGAIAQSKDTARSYVDRALNSLKALGDSNTIEIFTGIGQFVVDRYH